MFRVLGYKVQRENAKQQKSWPLWASAAGMRYLKFTEKGHINYSLLCGNLIIDIL
jgi:hypothetical protein